MKIRNGFSRLFLADIQTNKQQVIVDCVLAKMPLFAGHSDVYDDNGDDWYIYDVYDDNGDG